jgi:hypothetical protein
MTIEQKAALAISLMDRASDQIHKVADMMRPMTYGADSTLKRSLELLDSIHCLIDEHAPDGKWFKDYFTLTGDHMVLTEEGWELGEDIYAELPANRPEILDEVNAPTAKATA